MAKLVVNEWVGKNLILIFFKESLKGWFKSDAEAEFAVSDWFPKQP